MIMNIANSIDWDIGHRSRAAFRQELENICKVNFDDNNYYGLYTDLTFDIDAVTDSLYFNLEDAAENYGYTTRNIR